MSYSESSDRLNLRKIMLHCPFCLWTMMDNGPNISSHQADIYSLETVKAIFTEHRLYIQAAIDAHLADHVEEMAEIS